MRYFCTLFDRNYLYQGVALHRSLEQFHSDFTLYALCMDAVAYETLRKLDIRSLKPIAIDELLTPEIEQVRERTTHGQFCWVSQPLICEFILDQFDVDMVTYLESDSLFFSSPEALFEEIGARSVSLVPHHYAPGSDNTQTAGQFCVQFNAFRNDAGGRSVLEHWREHCFQYNKSAPLSYPGQTCLDEWPRLFDCVAVIRHRGAGVAPWNINGYTLEVRNGSPHVDGVPTVFYHYHEYGRYRNGAHELGMYPLNSRVVDCFYRPYVEAIRGAEAAVRLVDPAFSYRRQHNDVASLLDVIRGPSPAVIRDYLRVVKRKIRRRYNVYPDQFFSRNAGKAP